MDNLTHTLTALAISQAGLNRKTRFATLALVIAGNIPDVDIVTAFVSSARYLQDHRGVTHSILGATLLAGMVAGGIYAWAVARRHPRKKPRRHSTSDGSRFAAGSAPRATCSWI